MPHPRAHSATLASARSHPPARAASVDLRTALAHSFAPLLIRTALTHSVALRLRTALSLSVTPLLRTALSHRPTLYHSFAALLLPLLLSACAARPLAVPRPRSLDCRQPARTVERHAWSPSRRADLEQALAPHAADDLTATRLPARLDALATAWVLARADACRLARRAPDESSSSPVPSLASDPSAPSLAPASSSPPDFPARAACQNNVLRQHDALVQRLRATPAAVLPRADAAVDELEAALRRCDLPAVLALHRIPDPHDVRGALALADLERALGDGPATTAAASRIPLADAGELASHVLIALAWGTWLQGQAAKLPAHVPPADLVAHAELAVLRLFTGADADQAARARGSAALAAVRRAYGDADLRLIDIHRELARRHRLAGADADALAAVQAAIAIAAAHDLDPTLTPLPADLAQIQGDLEHRLGDYASAEISHRAALLGRERTRGPDHLATAEALHALATDLEVRDRLAEAIALYTRAAKLLRARPDDPLTARTYNNLGRALYAAREFAEARRFHAAALAIRRERLGDDHPDTATSLNNLGAVARAEGDLPGARALFDQALQIRRRVLGDDHPYTAISLNNLAEVLTAEGRLDEALALHERALAIRLARFGPDHPETARSQHNLGALHLRRGDLDLAEQFLKAAATTRATRLGPDHPETLGTLDRLRALADARLAAP